MIEKILPTTLVLGMALTVGCATMPEPATTADPSFGGPPGVAMDDIPVDVAIGLERDIPGARITSARQLVSEGEVVYRIAYERAGQPGIVWYTRTGQLVRAGLEPEALMREPIPQTEDPATPGVQRADSPVLTPAPGTLQRTRQRQ
jgi:hypothetical protein